MKPYKRLPYEVMAIQVPAENLTEEEFFAYICDLKKIFSGTPYRWELYDSNTLNITPNKMSSQSMFAPKGHWIVRHKNIINVEYQFEFQRIYVELEPTEGEDDE